VSPSPARPRSARTKQWAPGGTGPRTPLLAPARPLIPPDVPRRGPRIRSISSAGARVEALERMGSLELDAGRDHGVDLAAVLREAGGEDLLASVVALADEHVRTLAFEWSRQLLVGER